MSKIREMLADQNQFIFLDGAMGTMLVRAGLEVSIKPEEMNMKHADIVGGIAGQYAAAGSNIVYANTFVANRHKLKDSEYTVEEVVMAAVQAARNAVPEDTMVALDIGPIGLLVEPTGDLPFEDAVDIFKEMVDAGVKAGCDLVVYETMSDLNELRAGVIAAKENSDLPIFCTMSFEKSGRTYTGCSPEAMAAVLDGLGVDAFGINCSLGPVEILPFAKTLASVTNTPIIIKANAGMPDPVKGTYDITPEEFGGYMKDYAALGIRIMGGCCGTQPSYIEQIKAQAPGSFAPHVEVKRVPMAGIATRISEIDEQMIADSIIEPDEDYREAVQEASAEDLQDCLLDLEDDGADFLMIDVTGAADEVALMKEIVSMMQPMSMTPFLFRSNDPAVIEAALRPYQGKAVVVTDPSALDTVKPVADKYGAVLYAQGIVSY
ncbi:MAG: homocysteine S-methyltransferase family protein [Eubacterium sp.]|nr:homocysteine S-methyltransferase family protein [Eubacterium sp.]